MIRLTGLLCVGLFLVLLIAGQDKGQVRQGLLSPPLLVKAPVEPAPGLTAVKTVEPLTGLAEAVFVPAQPVRVPPATPVPTPVLAEPEPPAPQPEILPLAEVNTRSANVRAGPSTSDAVIGQLARGEQVLLVVEANPVEGWSMVRIEGDGIEGYVASRLLQRLSP